MGNTSPSSSCAFDEPMLEEDHFLVGETSERKKGKVGRSPIIGSDSPIDQRGRELNIGLIPFSSHGGVLR